MWALGGSLFSLLFAGAPIGISLAGATALLVLFDDFLTYDFLTIFSDFLKKTEPGSITFDNFGTLYPGSNRNFKFFEIYSIYNLSI